MTTVEDPRSQCPVLTMDYTMRRPEGAWRRTYDEQRTQFPWYRNEFADGFWTFVNYEGILQILQDPKTFSSSVVVPLDPNPQYKWIPEMLDGDEHKQWRRQLGPVFSPGAVERMDDRVRQRAADLVDGLVDKGSCDFIAEFAQKFPTTIFLEIMGLPVDELSQFLAWEDAILHSELDEAGKQAQIEAMIAVMGRFHAVITERRNDPRDDLISKAIEYQIDGKPVSDEDLLWFCLLMFMAGLDTVSATLGWIFLHLARNPEDRKALCEDRAKIPTAIEEFLRVYAIVNPGRKVTADVTVQGCPMKAGDLVFMPLAAATRDEAAYPNATTVDINRSPNNHIAFGAGPHRCLGSHLARRELRVAVEEWLRRIPDFALVAGVELEETGGQIGLTSLPLTWKV